VNELPGDAWTELANDLGNDSTGDYRSRSRSDLWTDLWSHARIQTWSETRTQARSDVWSAGYRALRYYEKMGGHVGAVGSSVSCRPVSVTGSIRGGRTKDDHECAVRLRMDASRIESEAARIAVSRTLGGAAGRALPNLALRWAYERAWRGMREPVLTVPKGGLSSGEMVRVPESEPIGD